LALIANLIKRGNGAERRKVFRHISAALRHGSSNKSGNARDANRECDQTMSDGGAQFLFVTPHISLAAGN
jgi:hypothetical protein